MKKIEFKPHTIIMTVGPSNCGKSYFCEKKLAPFFMSNKIPFKYFSSDMIRRQLLQYDAHKHDKKMLTVSKQAFALLESGVDNYTSYPVNTPIVIVDATNLSKLGRKNILEIAQKNNYNVTAIVFDYRERDDYFKYVTENTEKKIIHDMIKSMREVTLKDLERDIIKNIVKITSLESFDEIEFSYDNTNNSLHLTKEKISHIGDIHGCFDELIIALLDKKGLGYDAETNKLKIIEKGYFHHVLIGDLIDKGPKIKEVIEFVHNNMEFFSIVKGNHESWVYKYLKGELKKSEINDALIASYFNTVTILENDAALKQKFYDIVEASYDFITTENSIATHAPCENKYLGKLDKISIKKQRNFVYPKRRDFSNEEEYLDEREKAFDFLLKEGDSILPYHIFGHAMIKDAFKFKNKVGIDCGCVAGGSLATASYTGQGLYIKKYPSHQPKKEDKLIPFFRTKASEITYDSLDFDVRARLKYAVANGLNFVSGTMSPVDKQNNELENLYWGLNYYKQAGVKKVILQQKEMGSRLEILLHKTDTSKCKAYSRQGYELRETRLADNNSNKTLETLFKEMQAKYAFVFEKYDAEQILFDGELLPWNAMGKGLIEDDFILPSTILQSELKELKETGFYDVWDKIVERNNVVYDEEYMQTLKPKQDRSPAEERLYFNYREQKSVEKVSPEIQPLTVMHENLKKYDKQVGIFAAVGELEFKPFFILKTIKKDAEETNFINSSVSNIEIYDMFSKQYATVDLEAQDITDTIMCVSHETNLSMTVGAFYHNVTKNKEMEGIVMKPETAYIPNVAPYLKARNPEYLRLVYGMDYDSLEMKKAKLYIKKSIKNKLVTSIKEWELGKKMLDIKQNEISTENKQYIGLAISLFKEQDKEKELDPRL